VFLGGRFGGGSGGMIRNQAQGNVAPVGGIFPGPAPFLLRGLRGTHSERALLQRSLVVVVVERLGRRWWWGRRVVVGDVVVADERKSGGGGGQHGRVGGGSHHHVWQLWLVVRFPRIHDW